MTNNPNRSQAVLIAGAPKKPQQLSERVTLYHEDGAPILPTIVRGPFVVNHEMISEGLFEGIEFFWPRGDEFILNIIVKNIEGFERRLDEVPETPDAPNIIIGQNLGQLSEVFLAGGNIQQGDEGFAITSGLKVLESDDPIAVRAGFLDEDQQLATPLVSSTGLVEIYFVIGAPVPFPGREVT